MRKKSYKLQLILSYEQHKAICQNAEAAGRSLITYAKTALMQRPTPHPQLVQILLRLNHELTQHTNTLDQIAVHLQDKDSSANQARDGLADIREPLVRTLFAIKSTLVQGMPTP